MMTKHFCDYCKAEFDDKDECLEHERKHDKDFDRAVEILRQAKINGGIVSCPACPIDHGNAHQCDGCIEKAKNKVLRWIDSKID